MYSVFIADSFSVADTGLFGRAIANRRLLKAILSCGRIYRVYTTDSPEIFSILELPESIQEKITQLTSLPAVDRAFADNQIQAVLCSDFVTHFANWIHYRNSHALNTAVYGFVHSLSYQRFTADIYRILCAGPLLVDAILCTSQCAEDVLERLFVKVQATMSFSSRAPGLIRMPLPFETDAGPGQDDRSSNGPFQVLCIGRLDWQTKADLLPLKGIIRTLACKREIRFVVAGPDDNKAYLMLLQRELEPLGVRLIFSVSEEEKHRLYRESHAFFSPSDNYQETFGLTVIEAMHYGCVPLVTDFDGYRDLVRDGIDGFRIKTVAGGIPSRLFSAQSVISEATYHGWWAAGVAFDPSEVSRLIERLADDDRLLTRMSLAARESASSYSLSNCSSRIESLLDRSRESVDQQDAVQMVKHANPFVWDFTELFSSHPSEIWGKQKIALTSSGEDYLVAPHDIPQLILLSGAISIEDVRKFLFLVKRGYDLEECLRRGIEPVVASLALKNGMIILSVT